MVLFIPRLSNLTTPMRELLKKDVEFKWNKSHQKSLTQVNDLICKEMMHAYFDPTPKWTIQVNASSKELRAALTQNGKPIAFVSKALTEMEQWYANIEQETIGSCVYGSYFQVESNHKSLEMLSLKTLNAVPLTFSKCYCVCKSIICK